MGIILLLLVMMLMTLEVQKMCSFVTETAEGEEGGVSNTENCFNGFEVATQEWYKNCVTTYDVARWRSVEVTVSLSANARSSPEASSNGLQRRVLLSEECPCGKAN